MPTKRGLLERISAVLLIISSIALAFYQVVDIQTVSSGLLMYIAQAFLLAGSIFGLDYYVSLILRRHADIPS